MSFGPRQRVCFACMSIISASKEDVVVTGNSNHQLKIGSHDPEIYLVQLNQESNAICELHRSCVSLLQAGRIYQPHVLRMLASNFTLSIPASDDFLSEMSRRLFSACIHEHELPHKEAEEWRTLITPLKQTLQKISALPRETVDLICWNTSPSRSFVYKAAVIRFLTPSILRQLQNITPRPDTLTTDRLYVGWITFGGTKYVKELRNHAHHGLELLDRREEEGTLILSLDPIGCKGISFVRDNERHRVVKAQWYRCLTSHSVTASYQASSDICYKQTQADEEKGLQLRDLHPLPDERGEWLWDTYKPPQLRPENCFVTQPIADLGCTRMIYHAISASTKAITVGCFLGSSFLLHCHDNNQAATDRFYRTTRGLSADLVWLHFPLRAEEVLNQVFVRWDPGSPFNAYCIGVATSDGQCAHFGPYIDEQVRNRFVLSPLVHKSAQISGICLNDRVNEPSRMNAPMVAAVDCQEHSNASQNAPPTSIPWSLSHSLRPLTVSPNMGIYYTTAKLSAQHSFSLRSSVPEKSCSGMYLTSEQNQRPEVLGQWRKDGHRGTVFSAQDGVSFKMTRCAGRSYVWVREGKVLEATETWLYATCGTTIDWWIGFEGDYVCLI